MNAERKYRQKVTLTLKSGSLFSFVCDDFNVTYGSSSGHCTGYSIMGATDKHVWIDPTEIAAASWQDTNAPVKGDGAVV